MSEKIVKISEYSIIDFIDIVNEIFKDYVVPVNWSVLNFKMDVRENSISLSDSFVFLQDEKPVGFIVNAIRGFRGRIDAMGVVENERGKGLARRILTHALEHLKIKGIRNVVLEVAQADERAVKFYDKNGFRLKRLLHTMVLESPKPGIINYNFQTSDPRMIYSLAIAFELTHQRKPNWQREPITILLADGRYNYTRLSYHGIDGYLVWGKNEDGSVYIVDCATKTDDWDIILKAGISYLVDTHTPPLISIVAVPEDDKLFQSLQNNGFKTLVIQQEMCREL